MWQGCWNRSGVHANVPHLTRHETVTKAQQAGGETLGVTVDVTKEQSTQMEEETMADLQVTTISGVDTVLKESAVTAFKQSLRGPLLAPGNSSVYRPSHAQYDSRSRKEDS
jgi:hypothetical protein